MAARGTEMVLVIGGDGTLLRAAELARPAGVPLLGVNLGHVGFLAEAEPENLPEAVDRVVEGKYLIEQRMTIDVTVRANGDVTATTWALNEASVEKVAQGADARHGGRGGRAAAVPVGVRRGGVRDPDRLDRVRVLGGRAGGVAGGRGDADGADQRARPVRAPDGGLAALGARDRGNRTRRGTR